MLRDQLTIKGYLISEIIFFEPTRIYSLQIVSDPLVGAKNKCDTLRNFSDISPSRTASLKSTSIYDEIIV